MPYLQSIHSQHTMKTFDCLNDLLGDNYYRYLYNPFLQSSINYLKPSTALCMARTSDLQDFNRGTICGQEGLSMAAMLGPGDHLWKPRLVQGDYLWQPHLVQGTDYGASSMA